MLHSGGYDNAGIRDASANVSIDYITLSGRGEPTLAINLGDIIRALKKVRKEAIAVITNSSLMHLPDVKDELSAADFVIAKLDAFFAGIFHGHKSTFQGAEFDVIVRGINEFKRHFRGKFALQIMFIKEMNNMRGYRKVVKADSPR
jgi:wyosine [tRNA(Phe)-imidazoG37] synthetase (radical SAM superfamily)